MAKDPACLFYIDTWLSSTAEMDSDVRGWYLNLILHQYDKKDLPNDLEKLAVLAGVKFSEFERFKQMFEQVLKQKFNLNNNQRLENVYAKSILSGREQFKDKRQKSGNIGVVIKLAKTIKGFTEKHIDTLKNHLYSLEIEEIEKHKDKQVLEQMLKLYINENKNENNNKDKITKPTLEEVENYFFENGYKKETGAKAFKYYETGNWKDSAGKQVKNWKQKMQAVWFKEENKIINQKNLDYDPRDNDPRI